MIEDIWILGKCCKELHGETDFIENPNVDYAIVIKLEKGEDNLKFVDVETERVEKDEWKKYMYRRGPSNLHDFTPSSKLNPKEVSKTLNRIIKWAKNNENIVTGFKNVLENNRKEIEEKIEESLGKIKNGWEIKGRKPRILLTINLGGKYLDEILPRNYISSKVSKRFYEYENYVSQGNCECMLCGESGKVYGLTLQTVGLQFYTVDKPGFISNFSRENSWKQVSICEECSFHLEEGKKFLDNYLKFETGLGFSFYVIPSFLFKREDAIKTFIKKIEITKRSESRAEEYPSGLIRKEDKIYEIIEGEADNLRLNFLLFIIQNARFLILDYISDVKPSWLRKIYETQRNVKKENVLCEDWLKHVLGKSFTGKFIKENYIKLKKNNVKISWWVFYLKNIISSQNEYIKIISSILQNRKINYNYLIHKFNLYLQDSFRKRIDLRQGTLKTLSLYLFLNKLNLLEGEESMDEEVKNSDKKEIFEYGIFSNNERKHAFLVGALANYVLYVQRTERGNEPFRSKLNNLRVDQNNLRKILVECIEKLNQYNRNVPSWLPKNFDKILNTPEKWKSSVDEISYFFTLGLTLGGILFKDKKPDNNEGERDGGE